MQDRAKGGNNSKTVKLARYYKIGTVLQDWHGKTRLALYYKIGTDYKIGTVLQDWHVITRLARYYKIGMVLQDWHGITRLKLKQWRERRERDITMLIVATAFGNA